MTRNAVGFEQRLALVSQHLVDAGRAAPALLGKGKVEADCQHDHIARQPGGLLIEAAGLRITDRCIQRRHGTDDSDLAG